MNRQKVKKSSNKSKKIQNKISELTILSIFAFTIIMAFLSSISIQPNLTSIELYFLLVLVVVFLYKPSRLFILRSLFYLFRFTLSSIKTIFSTAFSFILKH